MKKKKVKKGFTLVELLAVIVILAIILVIAVPQIMSVIESARKGSIESTAKLIVEGAEREYTNRKILGKTTNVKCADVVNLNDNDYGTCVITFDNRGKATVKVTGKGKFEGYTCNGDSINMECVKGEIPGSAETAAQYFSYSEVEGGVSITGYNIEGGLDVVIPSEINGKKVVAIADYAFMIEDENPSISMNNTKKISPSYLYNNNNGKIVAKLASVAYKGLGITSVVIPSTVKSIGVSAFKDNHLTEVTIPSSVTSIGNYAFDNNQLTEVTIPSSVTSIGNFAFRSNSLTEVTIPNGISTIKEGTFAFNELTSIVIPSSVTSIGNSAFAANKLTEVTIPSGVENIGIGAFELDCVNGWSAGSGCYIAGKYYNELTKIVNKTNKAFNWGDIVGGDSNSEYIFVTGEVKSFYKENHIIKIVSE